MDIIKTKEYIQFRKYFLLQLDRLTADKHKIIISYFGIIEPDFIHQLIERLEYYLKERKIDSVRIKKLYSTALHNLNNMLLYGENDSENQKLISFFVTKLNDRYHLFSCNLITPDKELFLTNYITELNNLDKSAIEVRYQSAIESSFVSKDKNGIGLISKRHHSQEPLKFSFRKSNQKVLFSLEMC
jgi:hypothetical protein